MSISTVLAEIRVDVGADIYQLTDANGLRWYNDSRDEIIDLIISKNDEYFYNYNSGVTVIGQSEYMIAKRGDMSSDTVPVVLDGMHKIKGVSVLYKSTDTNMTKLRPELISNLDYDLSWYETNQPVSDAFYLVMDNSIFIYPKPTEVNPYRIYGITFPKKLIITDNETLPDMYSKVINYGVKRRYLETTKNDATQAKYDFEEGKIKIGIALDERIDIPLISEMPNTSNLQ